ncbi:MAG: hypothetical protein IT378_14955 [Sandaracinaceae bacterium]|nr:hypothetical protein [Sandaracinaceae bacterium]
MRTIALLLALAGCAADPELDAGSEGLGDRILPLFDTAGSVGCPGTYECPWSELAGDVNCVCQADFDHQNYARVMPDGERKGHVVVVSTDRRREEIRGMGNQGAHYVNTMNDGWERGASARAGELMREAQQAWGGGPPRWFLLNEISAGTWVRTDATGARYRRYVAELARHLSQQHGRRVIVFAPFARPGRNGADWRALAEHAYVGVEGYLSGADIRNNGFSIAWARREYQSMIDAYGRLGVRPSRLVMTEHFGHTRAGVGRGRSGLSLADWRRAIDARSRAASQLSVFGHASYAWGFNQMGASNEDRFALADLYHRLIGGGRLELPAPSSDPEPPSSLASEPACDPPRTIALDGRCVPSCAEAGGAICEGAGSTACDGEGSLESYDCAICCAAPEPEPGAEPEPPVIEPPPVDPPASCPSGPRIPIHLQVILLGGGAAAHCYSQSGACNWSCGSATSEFGAAFYAYSSAQPGTVPLYRCQRGSQPADPCARFWLTRDPACEGHGEGARAGTVGFVLPPDARDACGSAPLRRLYSGGAIDNHIFTHDPAYTPASYAYEGDVARVWIGP